MLIIPFTLLVAPAAYAQTEAPMLVMPVLHLAQASQVHDIGGFLGARYEAQVRALLAGEPSPWIPTGHADGAGHKWYTSSGASDLGKWLAAAVMGARSAGNDRLARRADQALQAFAEAQEESGYLGPYPPAERHPTDQPVGGASDAYLSYFLLHGLLTYFEETSDRAALSVARRLADYWVEHVGPAKVEFLPLAMSETISGYPQHLSMEGTLIFDPVMRLYEQTGDRRYLEWSEWVVASIGRWAGMPIMDNLKRVAEGELPLDQYKPHPHAHTTQMNLRGLLRLYRATADEEYLRMVAGVWEQIAAERMYVTGGVSVAEVYPPANELPNGGSVCETCATASWVLLTAELLELTGEAKYADVLERVVLNHLPAAQVPDGMAFKYHTPLNGAKPVGYYRQPDCCNSSGPWVLGHLPRLIYGLSREAVWVNLYVPSRLEGSLANGTELALRQETRFPEDSEVTLHVEPGREVRFGLYLRLPGWCEGPQVTLNGERVASGPPSTYLCLDRTWRPGDTVALSFPMTLSWVEGEHTNTGLRCLTRGPVVYCLDTLLTDGRTRAALRGRGRREDLPGLGRVVLEPSAAAQTPVQTEFPYLGPAYGARAGVMGQGLRPVRLWPFANAGCWYLQSGDRGAAELPSYPYALWVPAGDERLEQFRPLDEVVPGDPESELAHGLRGEAMDSGVPAEPTYRHAVGGWFSYRLRVDPHEPCALLVEYWGDDVGRRFAILVDGEHLVFQELERPAPLRFLRRMHDIPARLTAGKETIEVRFVAAPDSVAGGVFGLWSGTKAPPFDSAQGGLRAPEGDPDPAQGPQPE